MDKKHFHLSTVQIGILLIIAAIIFGVISFVSFKGQNESPAVSAEEEDTEPDVVYETEELLNFNFEIKGLSDDAFNILGFDKARLSEFLKTWTYENGYSKSTSASFYPSMSIDFTEDSYTLLCQLNDEDQTTITVVFYKQRDLITAHL